MQSAIRTLRRRASLTQEELARLLEVNQSAISQWETGRTLPDLEKLPKLAEALGVCIQDLFPSEDDPSPAYVADSYSSSLEGEATAATERDGSALAKGPADTTLIGSDSPAAQPNASVPIVSIKGAGTDNKAVEELVGRTVEVPSWVSDNHPNAQAVIVEDDFMNRVAPKGSVAVFDPDLVPTNNRVVIIETEDRGAIIRRWHRGANTLMLTTDSFQPGDDIVVRSDPSVRLVGTVVYVSVPSELL
ncbi:MAG: helix-turn-helix domain-containing protein [Atopobiaceae bacterium]|nr:helix-turn-helix domain-containing protein [Atopobiaceae bacterium]